MRSICFPALALALTITFLHGTAWSAEGLGGSIDLPYVTFLQFKRYPATCDTANAPICERDSIAVLIGGAFPNDCFSLRGVRLLPPDPGGPMHQPPIVRIVVDDGGCLDRPCIIGPVAWGAVATLGPLPAGEHELTVQIGETTCSDSVPPERVNTNWAPFRIVPAESCAADPLRCVAGVWEHGAGGCDAFISIARPARLTFMSRSPVALSELRGKFVVSPPGLVITEITTTGHAAGMDLEWERTQEGANFSLVGAEGTPIPGGRVPLLLLTVRPPQQGAPPDRTLIRADALSGWVRGEGEVPMCVPLPCARPEREAPDFGVVCAGNACDLNHDRRRDVRDLVVMLRCLLEQEACRDTAAFDCNQNDVAELDDVLCCATRMLTDDVICCDSSASRPEPEVQAAFSPARTAGAATEVSLRLWGADRLGAAMLAIAYPRDRLALESVDVSAAGEEDWMVLHSSPSSGAEDFPARLSLMRVGTDALPPGSEVELKLRFAHQPGENPAGEIRVVGGEFSGPDGIRLAVPLGEPFVVLGDGGRIVLSRPRPNPSAGTVAVDLAIESESDVEAAVYDLAGRRVRWLLRGRLRAGEHLLVWDGSTDRGDAARNGMFFVRVEVRGRVISRKLVRIDNR